MKCFQIKRKISHALNTKTPISKTVEEHISHCKKCHQFYSTASLFETHLQKNTAKESQFPPYLHTRIMAHVREAETKQTQHITLKQAIILGNIALFAVLFSILLFPDQKQINLPQPIQKEHTRLANTTTTQSHPTITYLKQRVQYVEMRKKRTRKRNLAILSRSLPKLSSSLFQPTDTLN